jgi:hypothetical protein
VLNILELYLPACPDRIIVNLQELKKAFLKNEEEMATHNQILKMLTVTSGLKKSKAEMLKDFITSIQLRKDELLTRFPVSCGTNVSLLICY